MGARVPDTPLPSAIKTEESLLGAVLLDDSLAELLFALLKRSDFHLDFHKQTYDAISSLYDAKAAINALTVGNKLRELGWSGAGGTVERASELEYEVLRLRDGLPKMGGAEFTYHARTIISHAKRRRAIAHGNSIIAKAYSGDDCDDLSSDFRRASEDLNGDDGGELIALAEMAEPGPLRNLVQDIIPEGYVTNLYADSGQGKSYIALRLALSVILGQPFLNREVIQGNVLYLDWELDAEMQRRRWGAICRGANLETAAPGLFYRRMDSSLRSYISRVRAWKRSARPALIIIDSVGKALGDDPLDPREAIRFYTLLEDLGSVLCIDHQGKGGESSYQSKWEFGSSYKRHLARSSWQLERVGDDRDRIGLILRHKKNNFGPLLPDIPATLLFDEDKVRIETGENAVDQRQFGLRSEILAALKAEPDTAEGLAEILAEYDIASIRNALTALKRSGLVRETGKRGRAKVYACRDDDHHNHIPIGEDDYDDRRGGESGLAYCQTCGAVGKRFEECLSCGDVVRGEMVQ
jgi:hypothetical protein